MATSMPEAIVLFSKICELTCSYKFRWVFELVQTGLFRPIDVTRFG